MRRAPLALALSLLLLSPAGAQPTDDELKKALQDALKNADPKVKKALEGALKKRVKPRAKPPQQSEEAKRAERALRRYKAYLSRKPYHGWAFDKLIEAAVKQNALERLVTFYEQRLKDEAEDFAARVVLARLYARTKQLDRSLELLKTVDEDQAQHPAMQKLLGELYLRGNRPKQALKILEAAAKATKDRKLLGEIQRRLGEAALATGDRARAVTAFRAIAELRPRSFNTRLEVADLLAAQGLHKEALAQLAAAERLAGKDTRKRCRVLSETGRLHERRIEIPQALAVYRKAIDLLGRGHWLKRDLYERVLSIHKRSGKLEALIAATREEVAKKAQDLDVREFLAQVLLAAGKPQEAREGLEAATKSFPEDLKLSRRLLTVLGELKDADAQIREYQRILDKHPTELDLYLELGKVFASSGKFEQAKRQWERTLNKRLKDASLVVRLAELYALYGQVDEAVGMYRRAMRLEPKEIAHYADLARLLVRAKRQAEVPALLEQAQGVARGDASLLQQVARLWAEHGQPARSLAAIQAALKLKTDPLLLRTQAKLQLQLNQPAAAAKTLHQVVELAKEASLRRAAVDNLLRLARRQNKTAVLIATEEEALKRGTRAIAPYLILGRAYARRREPGQAIRVYQALLKLHPEQEDAHRGLARLYEGQDAYEQALKHYRVLVERTPQARRKYLKAIAEIHLARYEQDKAFACYDQILAGSPNNPAAFKDVGRVYERLNLLTKARDCYQQAVRLKPEDPDLRLKLARVLQRLGENARARGEILAAVRADADDDDREDARRAYYELLGSQGKVDQEIEALRGRIENNPYDVEAPLILSDIYIREMEYELALELLEKLLGYQPRQPRLLEERARLSFLMERYPQAIRDYETLWKLPKADRQRLALKIAEAAIKGGDLERAARAVETVTDARKVADLYAENDLVQEAKATLERGIQRDPTNVKLHRELADLRAEIGEREGAIESMRAVLSLTGARWKSVLRLGELYHQAGDKQRALACGRRLFALIRQKDEDEEKKKKKQRGYPSYYYRYYGYNRAAGYQKRISELQAYFQTKGLKQEFGEIGLKELRLQPTNVALLNTLTRVLRGPDVLKGVEAVEWVKQTTRARKKLPPGYTRRSFEDYLDGQLIQLYRQEPKLALKRGLAMFLKASAGKASEWEYVGLAMFLGQQNREQEARGIIATGLKAHPGSVRLLLALADYHRREKRWAEAATWYRKAIAALEAPERRAADRAEAQRRADLAFRQSRRRLLQGFPATVQSRVKPAVLRRLFDLTHDPVLTGGWILGQQPGLYSARLALGRCLLEAKQVDAAKQVLAELLPRSPEQPNAVGRWSALAQLYHQEGLDAEAAKLCAEARALERKLERDPLLGLNRSWTYPFNGVMQIQARVLEKQDQPVAAYDLLRSYGQPKAGELLLTKAQAFGAAEAHYAKLLAAARANYKPQDPSSAFALRDAGIKHAEVLQLQKKWPAVLAAYEALIKDLPDDFSLYGIVAALHGRADRFEQAVETHKRIIARKRELKRRPRRNPRPEGRKVTPIQPEAASDGFEGWAWQNLNYSWGGWNNQGRLSVRPNYAAILKIYLTRKKTEKAAEVMRQLAREDVQTFRWMGWTLSELIKQYRLGAKGVPILRLLYAYNKADPWLGMEYGKALVADKKLGEARKVFERLVNKPGRSTWVVDQARRQLDQLDAREQRGKVVTYASLNEKADADPKNAKKRLRVARWLYDERRYAEALQHVERARGFAPHLKSVRKLYVDCLIVLGKRKLLLAALEQDAKRAKTDREKLQAWIRLANLHYDPKAGVTKEVERCLTEAFRPMSGRKEYTRVNWFMEHGLFEEAHGLLREELKKLQKDQWIKQRAEARMRQLDFLAGKPTSGLDAGYEELTKAISLGDKARKFDALASNLRALPNLAPHRAALLKHADAQPGLKKHLFRAAIHLALRDLDAAEQELEAAIALKPKETLYLHPVLIGLARAKRKPELALKRMAALAKLNPGSESRRVQTSVGSISERDAFRGEQGSLLFELGKVDEAKQLWKEILDPSDKRSHLVLAKLYEEHDLVPEAIAATQRYLKEAGERESNVLTDLAKLYLQEERYLEALKTLKKAVILAQGQQKGPLQATIQDVFRRSGRLAAYRKELDAKAKQDPNDTDTRVRLAQVLAELDDEPALIAVLEELTKKQNMAQGARSALATLHQTAGRFADAARQIEAMLEGSVQSWDRSQYTQRLADLYMKLGKPKLARAAIRKGHEDPEGPEALRQLIRFLRSNRDYAAAVEPLQQLVRMQKKNVWIRGEQVRNYKELKRHAEALEALWPLLHHARNNRAVVESWRKTFLELVDAVGGDAKVEAALAKLPDEAERLFRGACLDLARRRTARAVKRFRGVIAKRPDDVAARWELLDALERQGDLKGAAAALESLIALRARETAARNDRWANRELLKRLGRLYLRLGDVARAKATWQRDPGAEYREVRAYRYTHYNAPELKLGNYVERLTAHHFYAEALAASERANLLGANSYGRGSGLPQRLLRVGQAERALAIAWRKLEDPSDWVVSEPDTGRGFYMPTRAEGAVVRDTTGLLALYRELGRVPELERRLRALLKREPKHEQAQGTLMALLSAEDRHEELLKLLLKRLEEPKYAHDVGLRRLIVGALLELKRYADAVPHQRAVVKRVRSEAIKLKAQQQMIYRSRNPKAAGTRVRFRWGGNQSFGFSSGYSSYYSSMGRHSTAVRNERRLLMALLARAGKQEEAGRLEQRELRGALRVGQRKLALARSYARTGAAEQVERLCAAAVAEDEELLGQALGLRRSMYSKLKQAEALAKVDEALVRYHAKQVDEAKYTTAPLAARARFLLRARRDLKQAAADVARCLSEAPRQVDLVVLAGWIAYRQGDAEGARERFQEALALTRTEGSPRRASLLFGLGLTEPEQAAAKPHLLRALARDGDHPAADEARERLGLGEPKPKQG